MMVFFDLFQVYDLEHPAESLNSAPGCVPMDEMCQSGGMASCGTHGKCVGGWDFFHCDCSPGYAGLACEKGTASSRKKFVMRICGNSIRHIVPIFKVILL